MTTVGDRTGSRASASTVDDPEEWARRGYRISTDPSELDLDVVHGFLTESYWATGISRALVERSLETSLSFGLYQGTEQVGFARVVSDRATFAYLCDVFVLPAHRGQGLARWLCATVLAHPELQGLRRWILATRDAHAVYAGVGFSALASPASFMEILRPDVYQAEHAAQ
jgi:ribosomal protein S18 acetylase RimI-like enzyme